MRTLTLLLLLAGQAAGQVDTLFLTSSNLVIDTASFRYRTPMLRLNADGRSITFANADGKEATLVLDADSIRYSGELPQTEAAGVFWWAIFTVWNESYQKEWTRLVYLQNKQAEYSSRLTGEYRKAFELWLKQQGVAK